MSVIRFCELCRSEIPAERLEALPDTVRCANCSTAKPIQGLLDFGHKTGGSVVVLPADPEQRRLAVNAYRRKR